MARRSSRVHDRVVDAASRLIALAHAIDPERTRSLLSDLGPKEERAAAVLLGAAFPSLAPGSGERVAALEKLVREGYRVERRRRSLLRDASLAMHNAPSEEEGLARLRRFVWAERARIALRELLPPELGGASIEVTARELSALADVALEAALQEASEHLQGRFGAPLRADGKPSTLCAFGMGKLGGQELNAGSDVDLIFVYDTDEGQSGLSLNEHWSRVVRRAVTTLETPSADGLIWRVDLRLRPEGSGGALVNAVAATERYYETWGRLWERVALLRARPAAGDLRLGALVEREIFIPFVYRHSVDPSIGGALRTLVERARSELSPDPARDLKLGPGGIREAEFFVQALQLVWGGREPSLRVRGTLAALSRLNSRGLVSEREAWTLAEGYAFLRRLEHRVQWTLGVQTHLLPATSDGLARLGRTLGYADETSMLLELDRVRSAVAVAFESISPRAVKRRELSRYDSLLSALSDPLRAEGQSEELFESAEIADHLVALARRPDSLLGELTRDRHPEFALRVLEALGVSPDPEQAARYLRTFFGRFVTPTAYVTALAADERALIRLVRALGSSSFVGDALAARPELADVVVFGEARVSDPRAAVAAELEAQPGPDPTDEQEAEEHFVWALRTAKRRVMLEVAVADLAGAIGTRDATRLLSDLADESLRRATDRVLDGTRGLAVIALGKLGGRDIGYGSDLDLIFVYDPKFGPSREESPSFFARHAQRIIRLLSEPSAAGPGYELDTRLRPSGSQGLLVTSVGAFARYHGVFAEEALEIDSSAVSSGAAWERQVLLRARVAAGDSELADRVVEIAGHAAYEGGAPPVEEMHRLRERMELELGRERQGRYDLKSGRGGLLDIEFAVQWLQMRHGDDPRVRTADTAEALEALELTGRLSRSDFDSLLDGYRFLRRLEQRIHVLTGSSSSVIDVRTRGLTQLARRMGLVDEPGRPAGEQLLSRYEAVTAGVRHAYLNALGLSV